MIRNCNDYLVKKKKNNLILLSFLKQFLPLTNIICWSLVSVLFYFYDYKFLFLPRHQMNTRIYSFCRLGNFGQVLEGLRKPLLQRGHRRVCVVMERSKGQQRGDDHDTNVAREEIQTEYTELSMLLMEGQQARQGSLTQEPEAYVVCS